MTIEFITKTIISLLKAGQYRFGYRASVEVTKFLKMSHIDCVNFIIDSLESGIELKEAISNHEYHKGEKFYYFKNQNEVGIIAFIKMSMEDDDDKITVEIFSAHHDGFDIRKGV